MSRFQKLPKKRILISGAGVAGILSAILLDKNKYEIELIEKADSFRNIGFSITLWKTGFDLLTKIIKSNGGYIDEGKDCFKVKGFTLYGGLRLKKLSKLNANGFAWVFERSHLMEILENILLYKINKYKLFFSKTIIEIKKEEKKTFVKFNDGIYKEYDIVIIAEGINSTTRALIFTDKEIIIPLEYNLTYEWFTKKTNLQENGGLFFTRGHIGVIHPPSTKNLFGFYSINGTTNKMRTDFENEMLNVIKQPNGFKTELDHQTSHVFDLKEVHMYPYHQVHLA